MPVLSSPPQTMLASVWQKNLPLLRKRLHVLNEAATAANAGHLSAASRQEAGEIAHKLAGSLGMFGYVRGTEVARELEVLLDGDGAVPPTRLQELARQLGQAVPV